MHKRTRVLVGKNYQSHVPMYKKDKDTIRKFQKIKKVHVESLKSQLKESDT